jgi:predicted Zn-dependent protease
MTKAFRDAIPRGVDFASLRYHRDRDENVQVRQNELLPLSTSRDEGVMVTVHNKGGAGYAATSDLTPSGIKAAFAQAMIWAERGAGRAVVDYSKIKMPHPKGTFKSPVRQAWDSQPLAAKIERLMRASKAMKLSDVIVDWAASLWHVQSERLYLTDGGGEVSQDFDRLVPMLRATANRGSQTETRTFGAMAWARQQGMELLDECGFDAAASQTAREALELLDAPNCPSGVMDVILAPDQMVLQIHESIGHPLELDRILGDERNYAGTSFVTLDMFGKYQYGSKLLNVTVDPTRPEQAASFAFDDDGMPAEKRHLIKDGILMRPVGGGISRDRAQAIGLSGFEGTANSRADSWRRPAIDRMPNINVEPGQSSFDDMVKGIERGIYMRTNTSWSIDDSRNKFQFGCEWGQLIESGKLTKVVKKPNYRGISANFWRSLSKVGDAKSHQVLGTPYCGKGEPNQAVFVGHASPACLFTGVDVFGGE